MTHFTQFSFGMNGHRVIARRFKYYIRETPDHIWVVEDYHRVVIASFASRADAFEAVKAFVVEDRAVSIADKLLKGGLQ